MISGVTQALGYSVRRASRVSKVLLAMSLFVATSCFGVANAQQIVGAKKKGHGVVYIYRDKTVSGFGVRVPVEINGKRAAMVKNGKFLRRQLKAGDYVFSANSKNNDQTVFISVEEGGIYFVRLYQTVNNSTWRVKEVDQDVATIDLEKCCFKKKK